MGKWNKIYLFATENIKGYMSSLDFTNKKVITVAASFDHALNIVLKGCTDITVFDINESAKYYMDLKIEAIKKLNFEQFKKFILIEDELNLNYEIIKSFDLPLDSKEFWLQRLKENNNDGVSLRKSDLFDLKYYDVQNKTDINMYLNEENYNILKNKIYNVNYKFINSDLVDLELSEKYDYGFFANIADYLSLMYKDNELENYKKKIDDLKNNIDIIYIAYIYDINKTTYRSKIDNIEEVLKIFKGSKIQKFDTALISQNNSVQDGIIIY